MTYFPRVGSYTDIERGEGHGTNGEKQHTAASDELVVSGSGLHILRLDLESGSFSLEGHIDTLQYRDAAPKGSFFGRLFR